MRRDRPTPGRSGAPSAAAGTSLSVRVAVLQFIAAGMLALIIIAGLAFLALRQESTDEAVRDSRNVTRIIAQSVVEPALAESPGVLTGDPAAVDAFDAKMRDRVLGDGGAIARVKLWSSDGRVVYSDLPGLTGKSFELEDEERTALASDVPIAEVSDLDRPENAGERLKGKFLEVYFPVRGPDGQVLLFETYQRFSAVASSGSTVLRKFLPVFILSLVVLSLVQAPLAWKMARRLRESQDEREALLVSAIEASDRERRRIASEVHDGPVQELAGVSFALAGAADRAGDSTPPEVRRSLDDAATATRGVMRQLRGLLVEIHPPNLHAAGLEAALSDLLAPLPARGVETHLDVADIPEMGREVEALLFRGAQEAVRNVVTHSDARNVTVSVRRDEEAVRLDVDDDGRGFDAHEQERRRAEGHMGLELLRDLVGHAGGDVEVDSRPDHGTHVGIRVPLR